MRIPWGNQALYVSTDCAGQIRIVAQGSAHIKIWGGPHRHHAGDGLEARRPHVVLVHEKGHQHCLRQLHAHCQMTQWDPPDTALSVGVHSEHLLQPPVHFIPQELLVTAGPRHSMLCITGSLWHPGRTW